ncbi:hypothetical protein [Simkania negevensis]|uniref:hypothetical protein n=1 Tax=Simkania negevensis TaxID=83561 RepID=UPI0009AC1856|nr:hypothetical protein [Simkania negevensis]
MGCTILHKNLGQHPEVSALMKQLHQHPAWKDSLSNEEIDVKLLQSSIYSYFLVPAEQEGLFYIAFLDRDKTVHRHVFRIVPNRYGVLGFMNGTIPVYQDLNDLVVTSIGCAPGACFPCK